MSIFKEYGAFNIDAISYTTLFLHPNAFAYKQHITKIGLYNFDPLKPHFYVVKLRFTGVYIIFLISA